MAHSLLITLDELPYGNFTEIEGADTAVIRSTAAVLSLNWETRIEASYLELFEILKRKMNLNMRDLTFAEFADIPLSGADLGVSPADRPQFL